MTRLLAAPVAALAGAVLLVSAAPAAPVEVEKAVLDAQAERVAAIKKVHPAVVAVCMPDGSGCGSGVIIDPEGYALTNFHVVQPTGPFPTAGLADGVLYNAVVCGIDKIGDVALIKLIPKEKGKPFPFVKLGDSDKVKAGDWSLAMGNPFSLAMDFTPTVTYGVVSGVNRYQPPEGKGLLEYTDCIQIETSINPGNSGGPLFNMAGELIGVNGRGSFEKRGRVNSGVGYAISVNQIKNFMGHLRAGIDSDHATLGAAVGTEDPDATTPKMVVKQILDESDAARRGIENGDQLLEFVGRPMTSTNQYKNALGVYPKEWRVPLVVRRKNEQKEFLVRLMGNMEREREPAPGTPGAPPQPTPPPAPKGPAPKGTADTAGMYEARKGYSNWYFNALERDKLLAAFKKQSGDFAAVPGAWVIEGAFKMPDREGPMRAEVVEGKDGAKVTLKLNIETTLEPLKQTDIAQQKMPLGSGGLMMALYHYHRFLTLGENGFEGLFAHGGNEPYYPYPLDGSVPKSLAALRVDCAVLLTKHGSVNCKWYFAMKDSTLLGFECYIAKDSKDPLEADPCEVYFSGYKDVDGRKVPGRIEVRSTDRRYAVLEAAKWTLAKNHTMLTRSLVLAAVALVLSPAVAPAADPFAETVEKANRKLVKLFGAGGFQRLNNYGTGILISKEGHILTVASQLLDTSELVVHLYDGQRMRAQVLVTEPLLDVALVKIKVEGKKIDEPNGLDLDHFDYDAAVKRGPAAPHDWVLAMSNTFEIALRDEPLSVQRGVISAYTKMAGRRGVFEFPYTGEVYVVDAITNNPGAAGGALLTRKGELLGLIGREIKNSLTETWMNYAIPVAGKVEFKEKVTAKDKDGKEVEEEKVVTLTMPDFVRLGMKGEYKPVKRPNVVAGQGGFHGIVFVPNVLERTPAFVEDVVPGSPAEKAGLRPDDLVSFIDGEPVVSIKAFDDFVRKNTRSGSVIRLEVRRGEALQTIELTLGAHPPKPKAPTPPPPPPEKK